jgi:capsular exopolysaccharide synthesis family protein
LQNQINDLERKIENIDPLLATDEEKIALADYQDQLDQLTPVLELYQEIYTNLVVLGQGVQGSVSESTQLNQLKFTLDLYQQIYISSMASLESLRLSQAQSTPNVVQTEPAKAPKAPISPKPLQTAALAGVIGILLTGGVAFMIEYLDDTIKTPEEIKELTGLPVVGFISDFQSRSSSKSTINGKHPLFICTQPRSAISEAVRSLRTNLEFSAVDHPLSSIVITSVNPSEGKSTIAANLAFALAQSGKKTLLLDADMRRPNLHSFFSISNRIGLSDLLRSKLDLDQVIRTVESSPNIHLMTSGSIPPNPSELLASGKMAQILNDLKSRYDIVVIDSSPMVVTDPQILSSRVDGVIFVTQPGKTRVNMIKTNIGQLDQINARILGIVFNRIPKHRNSYYGGYYYSQYYSKGQPQYYEEGLE